MTILRKPVKRTTNSTIREQGKDRPIVVILRPPNIIGFRAKGCKREYQLTTEVCYTMAVRAFVLDEKKQKKLKRKMKGK